MVLLDTSDILSCMAKERKGTDRLWRGEEDSLSLTAVERDQLCRAREALSEDIKRLNNTKGIKKILRVHPEKPVLVALYPPIYALGEPKFIPADIPSGYVAAAVVQVDQEGKIIQDDVWIAYTLSVYGIAGGIDLNSVRDGRVPTQARYDLMGIVRETMADGTFSQRVHQDERNIDQPIVQNSAPIRA